MADNPKVIATEVAAMRHYIKNLRDVVVSVNDLDGTWTMKWSSGEKSGKGFLNLMSTYEFLKKVKGASGSLPEDGELERNTILE